jgi:hypothetical protein
VYNTALGTFIEQNCPAYAGDAAAIFALDPTGGGRNIPVGSTYAQYNALEFLTTPLETFSFTILERFALGATEVTGTTVVSAGTPFTVGNTFSIRAGQAGTDVSTTTLATIGGTGTAGDFVAAVSAADVPFVSARVNSAGNIVFTHSQGGRIGLIVGTGTPITTAGFSTSTPKVRQTAANPTQLLLSNWVGSPLFTYDASDVEPDQDPATGRLWYYSSVSDADIMIQDNGIWQGYQNVTNDVRGYDLTLTNASGPIIAAPAPKTIIRLYDTDMSYPNCYGRGTLFTLEPRDSLWGVRFAHPVLAPAIKCPIRFHSAGRKFSDTYIACTASSKAIRFDPSGTVFSRTISKLARSTSSPTANRSSLQNCTSGNRPD